MEVYKKYLNVKKQLLGWVFDKKHPHFKFQYVSGKQILEKIKPIFEAEGLLVNLKITPNTAKVYPVTKIKQTVNRQADITETEQATLWQFEAELVYEIVDIETGDKIELPFFATSTASAGSAQAFGSALTYAERYFWLKELGVSSDEDDPDATTKPLDPSVTTTSAPVPTTSGKDEVIEQIVELAQKFPEIYADKVESKVKGKSLDTLPIATLNVVLNLMKKESGAVDDKKAD